MASSSQSDSVPASPLPLPRPDKPDKHHWLACSTTVNVVVAYATAGPRAPDRLALLLRLAHVSRAWRSAVLACGSLWREVAVTPGTQLGDAGLDWLRRNVPLHLTTLDVSKARGGRACPTPAALARCPEAFRGLRVLDLGGVKGLDVGDFGALAASLGALADASALTLRLGDCGVDVAGLEALRPVLRRVGGLDLTLNGFGVAGANIVAVELSVNTLLTNLNLFWNYIGADGAKALAPSLAMW
jgi:hypothetical protein